MPDSPEQLLRKGRVLEAEAAFRAAMARSPGDPTLHCNLAVTLSIQKRLPEALVLYDRALQLQPDHIDSLYNRGLTRFNLGEFGKAVEDLKRVTQLNPRHAAAWMHLGISLMRLRCDAATDFEAVKALRKAVEIAPENPDHHSYLGQALANIGAFDEANVHIERAISLNPKNPEYRIVYAFNLLREGNGSGWSEMEARLAANHFAGRFDPFVNLPWRGNEIAGKTIYLHPEQGLGDIIQFVRYASPLADRGAKVIVGAPPPLASLLGSVRGISRVVTSGSSIPAFDTWLPLLSLPRFFDSIPAQGPYVSADPALVTAWGTRVGSATGLRVLLVASGNPAHPRDHLRSLPRALLAPLESIPNSHLFSLTDLDPHDLSDTAAIIMNVDLVISVDTAPAHLAGALGRQVWALLDYAGDWRWLRNRTDTPWYPTMKLYRQRQLGDWPEVIGRVAADLQARALSARS